MTGGSRAELPGGDEYGRLLLAARADPDLFGAVYDRAFDTVVGFFYRRTLCSHTAADLAAETFAQALAGIYRYHPADGTGKAWLLGIATNLYRQWLRHGRLRARTVQRLGMRIPTVHHDDLDHIESLIDSVLFRSQLDDALAALTPALREAVLLRIAHEMSYEDVARRLGCSVGAARVRVARGLAQLSRIMEAHE